jgi:hypothetical protein
MTICIIQIDRHFTDDQTKIESDFTQRILPKSATFSGYNYISLVNSWPIGLILDFMPDFIY